MLIVFHLFQAIGFYGFGNWVPKLISSQGITITNSLEYAFIIAMIYPVGPFVFTAIAASSGRGPHQTRATTTGIRTAAVRIRGSIRR